MKHTLSRNKNMKKNLEFFLILLIIVVWGIIILSPGGGFLWASPVASHKSTMTEIWSLSEIYINTSLQSLITTLDNKLIVMGSNDISRKSSIMAFEGNSGDMIWRAAYDGISVSSTVSKVIVGRAANVMALDGENGRVLWSTNIQANANRIVPKDNGNLLRLDSQTGYKESLSIFTSVPFILSSEQTIKFPFYVTVDTHTNILFVYLGDSAQLFAFQLPN